MRTREGMTVARAKGKLRGKQPKLSAKQQTELRRMHATGDYTIADLAELFTVSRATVYRTLQRAPAADKPGNQPTRASGRSPLPGRDPKRCFCAGWCREPHRRDGCGKPPAGA